LKQLENKNQKLITNVLNFYKEIGIDILVSNQLSYADNFLFKDNKKDANQNNSDTPKNRELKIKQLESSFENFDGCKLKKTSTNFVRFFGNMNSKLLIIDGPPDVEEDKRGVSFVSSKGLLFEKMLNAIELKMDETFIVKGIPWRPPGNRYLSNEEINICRPFILNLINIFKPKIILCLGEAPSYQILELEESIIKIRGKWRTFKSNKSNCKSSVLSTFSISHLLNRPDLKKYAWEDMKLLRNKIKEI
jgi:DNA polymerase